MFQPLWSLFRWPLGPKVILTQLLRLFFFQIDDLQRHSTLATEEAGHNWRSCGQRVGCQRSLKYESSSDLLPVCLGWTPILFPHSRRLSIASSVEICMTLTNCWNMERTQYMWVPVFPGTKVKNVQEKTVPPPLATFLSFMPLRRWC